MADLLGLCKEQSSHQKEKWQQQLEENESFGVHTQEHIHAALSWEGDQQRCHVLPYLSLPVAQAALQMPTCSGSGQQKPYPRSTHLEVYANMFLVPTPLPHIVFPNVSIIV